MQQFVRIATVFVAALIIVTTIQKKGSFDITALGSTDTSASVAPELVKKGSFDITAADSTNSFSLVANGTTKGGDVPVVTG